MKSILIDDMVDGMSNQFTVEHEGKTYKCWGLVKPLNYCEPYMDDELKKAMCDEIMSGHAIAVHFTEDEQDVGEIPTLLERCINEEKAVEAREHAEYLRLKKKFESIKD